MLQSSPLDHRHPAGTLTFRPVTRSTPFRGSEGAFFWLLTAAFVVAVALIHALFMAVALFQSVQALPIAHQSPSKVGIVSQALLRMLTLIPAIALLRGLFLRFGIEATVGSILRMIVILVVVATLEWWLFLGSMTLLDWWRGTNGLAFVPTYPYGISYRVAGLGLGLLCFGLGSQWRLVKSLQLRSAEAEAALRTSELSRLEEQIQPHFLFNALTAVLACRHDAEAVASVTIGLSEHLRSCLSRQRTLEPLAREIEALGHYLTVQRVRFGERLDCRITCSPEAGGLRVPPVLVEPLLDNAFKHGAATSPDALRIDVDCRVERAVGDSVEESVLIITVDNSGRWIEPGVGGRHGTGLANLRRRLDLLDVRGASLETGPAAGGVRAILRIPLCAADARAIQDGSIGERQC